MRKNTAKERMLAGQPVFGYSLRLGSPYAAEILANSGIDFILLDTQHGTFGPDLTNLTLMAMRTSSAIPMARVARNDYTLIGRLLDEGTMGIIVPMIDTADDARAVADACLLPPTGNRSWGWGSAGQYGADYPDWINQELFVAVQIESITAVENAEAILAVDGIDGCWTGPADMALTMGLDPRTAKDDPRHQEAIQHVLDACRKTGKIPGIAAQSPAEAKARAEQGFQFITAGNDAALMLRTAQEGVRLLHGTG
jgi:4-hydroxy-2-oxoheptanedioate aldolase